MRYLFEPEKLDKTETRKPKLAEQKRRNQNLSKDNRIPLQVNIASDEQSLSVWSRFPVE